MGSWTSSRAPCPGARARRAARRRSRLTRAWSAPWSSRAPWTMRNSRARSWARCPTTSLQGLEAARRGGRARHVHHHADGDEVAHGRGEIDDTLLAKEAERARVRRIRHGVVAQQLGHEIMDEGLVVRHDRGPLARLQGIERRARHTGLQRERMMDHPFEIVAHVARDAEDRELVQSLRDRIVEAQVLAHALQALEELGAAQERDEWAHHRLARPGDQRPRRFLLGILHPRFVKRRHAIDHGILGWRGGRANANALATRAAPAMTRPGVKPRPPAARRLITAGPTPWPAWKDQVIAAMRRRAAGPATRRASCIPAIVTTMKVPPTSSAEAMMPARPGTARGIGTPSAITPCPAIHSARSGRLPRKAAAAKVLAAAAAPKRGHDHPYTAGSGNASRAIAARNVAGMM